MWILALALAVALSALTVVGARRRWEVRNGRFVELSDSGGNPGPDAPDEEHGGLVFRVPPAKVMVFGDDHGQTTYRF